MDEETNSHANDQNSGDVFQTNNSVPKPSHAVKDLEDRMTIKNTDRSTATAMNALLNFVFSKMDCGKAGKEYIRIVQAAKIVGIEHSDARKKKSELDLFAPCAFPRWI